MNGVYISALMICVPAIGWHGENVYLPYRNGGNYGIILFSLYCHGAERLLYYADTDDTVVQKKVSALSVKAAFLRLL